MTSWASLVAQRLKSLLECGRPRFDPWVGKIPWRRKWQPTPVLLPEESHGGRSLVGYSPWGRKELGTTERLHFSDDIMVFKVKLFILLNTILNLYIFLVLFLNYLKQYILSFIKVLNLSVPSRSIIDMKIILYIVFSYTVISLFHIVLLTHCSEKEF